MASRLTLFAATIAVILVLSLAVYLVVCHLRAKSIDKFIGESSASRSRHVRLSSASSLKSPSSASSASTASLRAEGQRAVAAAILADLDRTQQQQQQQLPSTGCGNQDRKHVPTDGIWERRLGGLVEAARGEALKWARLSEKKVLVGSHEIAYLERKKSDKEKEKGAIVLLHGFCGSKDIWIWMSKNIPDEYRVVALDVPGFGDSSRISSETYDAITQSDRIAAFLDQLFGEQIGRGVVLVGNSMGGNIAARVALKYPQMVSALVLMNSLGVGSPVMSQVGQQMLLGKNLLLATTVSEFERLTEIAFVRPPTIPAFVTKHIADKIIRHTDFNRKVLRDLASHNDDLTPDLPRISQPTLVIWGDHDRVIDVSAANVFQNAIFGSETAILPSCGHVPMAELPNESAKTILNFLARRL